MKPLRILLSLLLSLVLFVPLTGCSAKLQEINWELHGVWISENGQVGEPVHFSISGKIPAEDVPEGEPLETEFSFTWPENFPYMTKETNSCVAYPYTASKNSPLRRIMCSCFAYVPSSDLTIVETFALCPDKEWVIINWNDQEDVYLVASTDPNTDPTEILEFYNDWFPLA